LIYKVEINENDVKVLLTFTSPMCPYGPQMVSELEEQIKAKGAVNVTVEVTFEPPWKPSDELREMLGV
jgi:metal-sulfur cluster biosynthetic enzyme